MTEQRTKAIKRTKEYLISIFSVIGVAVINYFASDLIGYRITALFLLVTVSLLAMIYDIFPVLVAALLSALVWDFFFIPPRFQFSVSSAEDLMLFFMYFVIASLNAVFTFQIRKKEKEIRRKEEKEKAIKLYNTLLNSLSHELRTPIATIIGAADAMKDNPEKLSEENKNTLLTEISEASMRLNHQVDNLLNMSRIESGVLKPKLDWCDIGELIYNTIHKLENKIKTHPINVELQKDLPLFKLDYGLMEQVVFNLLNNAVAYTPEGTAIQFAVTYSTSIEGVFEPAENASEIRRNKTTNELVIRISDKGPGFPADELKFVFDKFYRIKHTSQAGTGLGLSIVKGFVEAHKGKIELNNMANGGAEFTIRIPAETTFMNLLKNE